MDGSADTDVDGGEDTPDEEKEKPKDTEKKPEMPKTGDQASLVRLFALLVLSGGSFVITAIKKKCN